MKQRHPIACATITTLMFLQIVAADSVQGRGGRIGTPARVPDTLEAFVAGAEAFVHGVIIGSDQTFVPLRPGETGDPLIVRKHTVRVKQVLKGDEFIKGRQVIKVAQVGGTLEVNGREVTTPFDQPIKVLENGDEVVLALIDWPTADAFSIRWAAAGIFPVSDGKVHPRAEAASLPEFKGRRTISLLDFLSAVKR